MDIVDYLDVQRVIRLAEQHVDRYDFPDIDNLDSVISSIVHALANAGVQFYVKIAETDPTPLPIKAWQHCTSKECHWTLSHTAKWCGYEQPRRCGCAFCYPKGRDAWT